MTRQEEESERIRRFLLGDLDEEGREQLEERLLSDAGLQEQVEATRGDLADEYVFGLMDEHDLRLFESNFHLTPEQSHELRLSRALRKYAETADETPPAEVVELRPAGGTRFPRWWALAAAAVVVAAVGYGGWALYHNQQLAAQLERQRVERLKVEQELAVLNRRSLQSGDPSVISLSPASDIERGDGDERRTEESRAVVGEGKNFLLIRLRVNKGGSGSYRAVIQNDDGADIYTVSDRKAVADAGGRAVELLLPARLLPTGNYQVKLVGDTGRDSEAVVYPFQVVQK